MLIQENNDGITVRVKVQPKASKNEISGIQNDELKVRLTAPPVDGAGNKACIEFFAKLCSIPKAKVEIVQGQTGRNKRIKLTDVSKDGFLALIDRWI